MGGNGEFTDDTVVLTEEERDMRRREAKKLSQKVEVDQENTDPDAEEAEWTGKVWLT